MANGNVDIMNAVMDTFFQKMSPLVFKLLSLKQMIFHILRMNLIDLKILLFSNQTLRTSEGYRVLICFGAHDGQTWI